MTIQGGLSRKGHLLRWKKIFVYCYNISPWVFVMARNPWVSSCPNNQHMNIRILHHESWIINHCSKASTTGTFLLVGNTIGSRIFGDLKSNVVVTRRLCSRFRLGQLSECTLHNNGRQPQPSTFLETSFQWIKNWWTRELVVHNNNNNSYYRTLDRRQHPVYTVALPAERGLMGVIYICYKFVPSDDISRFRTFIYACARISISDHHPSTFNPPYGAWLLCLSFVADSQLPWRSLKMYRKI